MPRYVVAARPEPLSVSGSEHLKSTSCLLRPWLYWFLPRCLKFISIFIPILLYECETWMQTPALLYRRNYSRRLVKRILKLSKYHEDPAPIYQVLPSI